MKKIILLSMIGLITFVLVSCMGSLTDISGSWKKPGFSGKKFSQILVVAITNDLVKRNSVETAVVKELKANNKNATTSSAILNLSVLEKDKDGNIDTTKLDAVKKTLSDAGYDGAVVISLLDIKEKTEYVPGQTYYQPNYYNNYGYGAYSYNGFYNYSYLTYSVVNTPGYYTQTKNIFIETRLFDLKENDMKWAAQSETLNPSNMSDFSSSLASAVVNELVSKNIVR